MTMTTTTLAQPVKAGIDHDLAMRIAAAEYERFASLLRSLDTADWTAPTACPGWDVRAIAAHTLGMVEMMTSMREQRRQNKVAGARLQADGGEFIDSLTAIQVEERAGWTPEQIMDRLEVRGPKAATGRRRAPGFIRRRTLPVTQLVDGNHETWTIGYMVDTILTRDPWMHRIDIVRATGAHHELTPEHDGVIVADVVAEWAARHGRPVSLRLTGPAGGEWTFGSGGPALEYDAADFCATLSGRGPAEGLLATHVPF
jgi:uncharacterized protein (TIGR03083 family)